jgi:hypothetical protein
MSHADPVMLDLARHDREGQIGEELMEMAAVRARDEARYDVNDSEVLGKLIYDYEIDPSSCLARCFSNLDSACRGEQTGRDAITTALHILRERMIDQRTDNTVEKKYQELRG